MTNKEWDEFHKKIETEYEADKDLIKFMKRFYRNEFEKINILDAGCGMGRNTAYMSHFYKNATCRACDFSARALLHVNAKLKERKNVLLKQCDLRELDYKDNMFDLIVSDVTFASIKNNEKVLQEYKRVLKPKGRLFLKEISNNECNNDNKYLRRRKDVNRFSEKQMYDLMKDFDKVETKKSKKEDQNIEYIVCIGRKNE